MLTKKLIDLLCKLLEDCWFITITIKPSLEDPSLVRVQTLVDYGDEEAVRLRVNGYQPQAYAMNRLGDLIKIALETKKMKNGIVPIALLIGVIILSVLWILIRGG